eukprot:330482-Amphidinium_carterae.1
MARESLTQCGFNCGNYITTASIESTLAHSRREFGLNQARVRVRQSAGKKFWSVGRSCVPKAGDTLAGQCAGLALTNNSEASCPVSGTIHTQSNNLMKEAKTLS